jgi:hypothetical protein
MVSQVRCMICSVVEGNEKLSPKLDTLHKHVGRKKRLLLLQELLLRIGIITRNLHMQKMKGYMLAYVLK